MSCYCVNLNLSDRFKSLDRPDRPALESAFKYSAKQWFYSGSKTMYWGRLRCLVGRHTIFHHTQCQVVFNLCNKQLQPCPLPPCNTWCSPKWTPQMIQKPETFLELSEYATAMWEEVLWLLSLERKTSLLPWTQLEYSIRVDTWNLHGEIKCLFYYLHWAQNYLQSGKD